MDESPSVEYIFQKDKALVLHGEVQEGPDCQTICLSKQLCSDSNCGKFKEHLLGAKKNIGCLSMACMTHGQGQAAGQRPF